MHCSVRIQSRPPFRKSSGMIARGWRSASGVGEGAGTLNPTTHASLPYSVLIRGEPILPRTADELLPARLLAQLDRLDVASRNLFAGKLAGERRSKRRGRSVEFDDYRDYTPGDDPRFIDWNALARLDRLVIKLFLEEQDLAVHILLDASASMRDAGTQEGPPKVVYAQRLAFALSYIALSKENRVSISVATRGGAVRSIGEMRGRRNIQRAGRFIVDAVREEETGAASASVDLNTSLREFAKARRGAGVSVVLSDLLSPGGVGEGLRSLASGQGGAASFDGFAVQILAPGELEPERDAAAGGGLNGDLRLVDVETGAGVETSVSAALIKRYRENLEKYLAEVSSECARRNIAHVLLRTDTPLEEALLRTLRQRGLLR